MKKNCFKTVLFSLLTAGVLFVPVTLKAAPPRRPAKSRVTVVDEANFYREIARGVVLVDFYADWCPPCRRQAPIAEEAAAKLPRGARIIKINVDKAKPLARKYRIRAIPTWVVFKNGREAERFSGLKRADFLINTARKHLR